MAKKQEIVNYGKIKRDLIKRDTNLDSRFTTKVDDDKKKKRDKNNTLAKFEMEELNEEEFTVNQSEIFEDLTISDYECIKKALFIAHEYGLQTEVILFAMKHLKDNPIKTIKEAIDHGLGEWLK